MINGNEKTSENYDIFYNYVLENIETTDIDKRAARSIIGSCVEFEQTGVNKSAKILPMPFTEKRLSIKFSNIKFNLQSALDIILLDTEFALTEKKDCLLFIMRMLRLFIPLTIRVLDKDLVKVLKTIYVLSNGNHGAKKENILKSDSLRYIDQNIIMKSLQSLIDLKCVTIINEDEYILIETILLA